MIDYETADNRVITGTGWPIGVSTFPKHWGPIPADLDERERWMRRNIREGEERMNRGERVQGQRVKTGRQAMAALERRRESPVFANEARMRLLELWARGPV